MKVIMPMAGLGTRFKDSVLSKPLIPTNQVGEPMWRTSAECLALPGIEFIFVIRKQMEKELRPSLEKWNGGSKVISLLRLTDGPLSTVLEAEEHIDDGPIVIANCDQFVQWSKADLANYFVTIMSSAGAVVTMNVDDQDRKWSYVKRHGDNIAIVAEKVPISDEATLGIYGFENGREFVKFAHQMIASETRVNGEFYVGPVYNQMIAVGKRIKAYNLTERNIKWCGLGTPEDLIQFKKGECNG